MPVLGEPRDIIRHSELLEHTAQALGAAEGASEAASWIDWFIDQAVERWPKSRHDHIDPEFTKHMLDNIQAHIDNLRDKTGCGSWRDETGRSLLSTMHDLAQDKH